jgi:hypothetical protein
MGLIRSISLGEEFPLRIVRVKASMTFLKLEVCFLFLLQLRGEADLILRTTLRRRSKEN